MFAQIKSLEGKMDRTTDLIVIGAGAAGLTAALTAAQAGAKVLILEKEGEVGGSTVLSSGSVVFSNTDLQKSKGIEDSPQSLFDDIRRIGDNKNDPEVVRTYVDHQLDTYNWMVENGVKFSPDIGFSEGSQVQRKHFIDTHETIQTLLERVLSTGLVEIVYGARAWALITDPEQERVVGVEVEGTEAFAARAKFGVVLASGGFAKAPDLLGRFSPKYKDIRTINGKGNTGDGLLMGWKLGADIVDTPFIQGNYGQHRDNPGPPVLPLHKGAIAVNNRGNRYVDESVTYKQLADASLAQPEKQTFQVFDSKILDSEEPDNPKFSFKARVSTGDLLTAGSLAELAVLMKVPPANLEHTIIRYNSFVESGEDLDYQRSSVEDGKGKLVKLDKPPFFAFPTASFLLGTYCGLRINNCMQVVDVFGMEIEGLYAAGEVAGSFHGAGELPGTALGKAFVFGRVAAKTALSA
jgi:fumarate reductase flavoprotein subunit